MKFTAFLVLTKKRATALLMTDVRSAKVGTAEHPSGEVFVAYESKDGAPGPEVSKALREIADSIDKGGHPVHDITPIIPEASA